MANLDAELLRIANEPILDEAKKKKDCSSVTYTTGDAQKNVDHFNKMLMGKEKNTHTDGLPSMQFNKEAEKACEKVGTFAAASPDGASSVSTGGDAGSASGGEAAGCCEALELDEDKVFVSRLNMEAELPPEIKLLDQADIERFIDVLEPEQEFEVGYVNAIFFYKELWAKMPIFKCTEFTGYTGVDFEGSEDSDYDDKESRIARAKNEISRSKQTGKTFEVGSDVDYSLQNKLVSRTPRVIQDNSTTTFERLNTILFYPTKAPKVCYFVKLPDMTEFIKINTEQLQEYIYDLLPEIKLRVTPEAARKTIHKSLYGDTDQMIDKETQDGKEIAPKLIYKYDKVKRGVRALYTNQIYYIAVNGMTAGQKIAGMTNESLDLTETKRYVRRYYMKPQEIFCSNKDEVLKALIDHEDEDCVIYTLINLGDIKDISKLNNDDIIYYYEDGILYDKNHVRIMDYELSIKHEEERPHINPETTSDARLADVYADRMTGATDLEEKLDPSFDASVLNKFIGKEIEFIPEHKIGVITDISFAANGELTCTIKFGKRDVHSYFMDDAIYGNNYNGKQTLKFVDQADQEAFENATKDYVLEYTGARYKDPSTIRKEREEAAAKWAAEKAAEDAKLRQMALDDAKRDVMTKEGRQRFAKWKKTAPDYNPVYRNTYLKAFETEYIEYKKQKKVIETEEKVKEIVAANEANKEELRNWLREHTVDITFTLPRSEMNITSGRLTDKELNKFDDIYTNFMQKFPDAVEGEDYTWREADEVVGTNAEDTAGFNFWRLLGKITFDVKIKDAPDSVKKLISDAKIASHNNGTGAVEEYNENSHSITSTYVCYAVLRLFNDDLHFYEKNVQPAPITNNAGEFGVDFPEVDEYGGLKDTQEKLTDSLHEGKEHKCCICGEEIEGYGNNAEPYAEGTCCDACNLKFVLPARLEQENNKE